MGERFEARPMATPPSIRHATKMEKLGASALPREVTREQKRGEDQQSFAAELVAQRPGHQRADEATDECATVRPAGLRGIRQVKITFEKRLRPANDHPILAEQQPAQRGHDRNPPDISQMIFGFEGGTLRLRGRYHGRDNL